MQQDGWILCLARLYYANLFEIVKKGGNVYNIISKS